MFIALAIATVLLAVMAAGSAAKKLQKDDDGGSSHETENQAHYQHDERPPLPWRPGRWLPGSRLGTADRRVPEGWLIGRAVSPR